MDNSVPPTAHAARPAANPPSLELQNVEDPPGKVADEEHGRDADEDGEEAPLGAVGHLQAE